MKQFTTKKDGLYGWNVLYDKTKSRMLEAGVILCYKKPPNKIMLFELDEDVDLFTFIDVEALPGSAIVHDFHNGGWEKEDPVAKIPLSCCRFPTEAELEEYEKMVSV